MIRILFVIPTLDQSGAEKQLSLLAAGLDRSRFEPQVICLTRGGPYAQYLQAAGVPVTILEKRAKLDLRVYRRLRHRIVEWKPDVVSTWLFAANCYGRLAAPRGSSGPRMVISERCVDSWKAGWQLWLDRQLISRTDRLVANSRSVADFYAQQRFPTDKIVVIPNGVEIPPHPEISRAELLTRLGWPSETILVGFVGRLAPQKRIADLLWGMQLMRQAEPRARLLLIGDGPLRESLQQTARDLEVVEFVRFLGHRADASALIHLLDQFWLASEFEGLSNSLMEALACGKPVVVSSIPANRELVQHDQTGWLVNLGDGAGFAQFGLRIVQQPQTARQVGEQAAAWMREQFSTARMIASFEALFESLVRGEQPTGQESAG